MSVMYELGKMRESYMRKFGTAPVAVTISSVVDDTLCEELSKCMLLPGSAETARPRTMAGGKVYGMRITVVRSIAFRMEWQEAE